MSTQESRAIAPRRSRGVQTVFSSDGTSLRFEDPALYAEYEAARKALDDAFYLRIRETSGIWAGNQDKFVSSPAELNAWDPRTMENRIQHLLPR